MEAADLAEVQAEMVSTSKRSTSSSWPGHSRTPNKRRWLSCDTLMRNDTADFVADSLAAPLVCVTILGQQ